jgi:hypothetical protein
VLRQRQRQFYVCAPLRSCMFVDQDGGMCNAAGPACASHLEPVLRRPHAQVLCRRPQGRVPHLRDVTEWPIQCVGHLLQEIGNQKLASLSVVGACVRLDELVMTASSGCSYFPRILVSQLTGFGSRIDKHWIRRALFMS